MDHPGPLTEPVSLLMLQFLDWVASRPRTYAEAMEAWRTTCPGLTIWEDAIGDGLIEVRSHGPMPEAEVRLTPRGQALLPFTSAPPPDVPVHRS